MQYEVFIHTYFTEGKDNLLLGEQWVRCRYVRMRKYSYETIAIIREDSRWVIPWGLDHEFLRVEVRPAPIVEYSMKSG